MKVYICDECERSVKPGEVKTDVCACGGRYVEIKNFKKTKILKPVKKLKI